MKKLLLVLMSLFAMHVHAMVEETVSFNFKEPLNLNINPELSATDKNLLSSGDGLLLNVSSRTISEGPVTISFDKPSGTPGVGFGHYGANSPYCLEIGRMASLKFNVSGGCVLTSVNFDQDTDIILPSGQPGSWNYMNNTWTASDNNTTSVTLTNGDQSAKVYLITIKYKRPSTPMNFISSSPAANEQVMGTFKTMTLSFSSSVTQINNTSSIMLTGEDLEGTKINQVMNVGVPSGRTVTLTVPDAISKDSELKVTIPAGTFENSEGAANMEDIVISFSLLAKRDDFNPTSIDPDEGTVSELPQEIRLTFKNFVKIGTGVVKFKQQNGDLSFPATLEVDAENTKVAIIKHTNGRQIEAATWTVDIPAKVFHNQYYEEDETEDHWNEAKTLTYIIDGTQAGPQDSETMKAAKDMLQKTGVGYPKTTDAAWIALNALVNAEETPTDDALKEAMGTLSNVTDVALPEVDKWYSITGFNSDGKEIYLTFSEDKTKVVLGSDAAVAASFKVKSVDGNQVVFQTKEGLYLHVPTVLPQHVGTTDANLTAEESVVNKLTLEKFKASSVEGADPVALYGSFTLYGSLGTVTGLELEDFAYAMLDYDNTKIATYPNIPLSFNSKMSSAFKLTDSTEPVEVVDLIYPTIGFIPDVIDNPGDAMKMKVNGPTTTAIADASLIYFTKYTEDEDNGTKVNFTGTILSPTSEANIFNVNTAGLASGMYCLVMENGAFTYTVPIGKGVRPISIVGGPLTIKSGSGEITPVATLSRTSLEAGDAMVLTVGNVGKAALKTPTAPYYEYADGENKGTKVDFVGTILTSKANTTATFNVNTAGLTPGNYKLVLPSETFTFEAGEDGKTIKENVTLTVPFEIIEPSGPAPEDFLYVDFAYVSYFPASRIRTGGYFRDTDLNELFLYVYDSMGTGLVANPEKKVSVVTFGGAVATIGHFENYPTFIEDNTAYLGDLTGTTAIKFVPDTPLKEGDLDNWGGIYYYRCEAGAFGDANYGKWLNNPSSVSPSSCRVNRLMDVGGYQINNDRVTGIATITVDEPSKFVYDLQGRRVDNMTKKGIYIVNGKKVAVK